MTEPRMLREMLRAAASDVAIDPALPGATRARARRARVFVAGLGVLGMSAATIGGVAGWRAATRPDADRPVTVPYPDVVVPRETRSVGLHRQNDRFKGAESMVLGHGSIWVEGGNLVARIDPASGNVVARIGLEPPGLGPQDNVYAGSLAVDADSVWVLLWAGFQMHGDYFGPDPVPTPRVTVSRTGHLARVDVDTNRVAEWLETDLSFIASGPAGIWGAKGSEVFRLGRGGAPTGDRIDVGGTVDGLVVGRTSLWTLVDASPVHVDALSGRVVGRGPRVAGTVHGMTARGDDVWLTQIDSDSVSHVDALTHLASTVKLRGSPYGVAVDDAGMIWASYYANERVNHAGFVRIDPAAKRVVADYAWRDDVSLGLASLLATDGAVWAIDSGFYEVFRFVP